MPLNRRAIFTGRKRWPSPEDMYSRWHTTLDISEALRLTESARLSLDPTDNPRRGHNVVYTYDPPTEDLIAEIPRCARIRISPKGGPGGCIVCGDLDSYQSPCKFCREDALDGLW